MFKEEESKLAANEGIGLKSFRTPLCKVLACLFNMPIKNKVQKNG
jgi:hypothetical protein